MGLCKNKDFSFSFIFIFIILTFDIDLTSQSQLYCKEMFTVVFLGSMEPFETKFSLVCYWKPIWTWACTNVCCEMRMTKDLIHLNCFFYYRNLNISIFNFLTYLTSKCIELSKNQILIGVLCLTIDWYSREAAARRRNDATMTPTMMTSTWI